MGIDIFKSKSNSFIKSLTQNKPYTTLMYKEFVKISNFNMNVTLHNTHVKRIYKNIKF